MYIIDNVEDDIDNNIGRCRYGWKAPIWAVTASLLGLSAVDWLLMAAHTSADGTPAAEKTAQKKQDSGMRQSIAVVAGDSQLCLLFLAQAMCLAVSDALR